MLPASWLSRDWDRSRFPFNSCYHASDVTQRQLSRPVQLEGVINQRTTGFCIILVISSEQLLAQCIRLYGAHPKLGSVTTCTLKKSVMMLCISVRTAFKFSPSPLHAFIKLGQQPYLTPLERLKGQEVSKVKLIRGWVISASSVHINHPQIFNVAILDFVCHQYVYTSGAEAMKWLNCPVNFGLVLAAGIYFGLVSQYTWMLDHITQLC